MLFYIEKRIRAATRTLLFDPHDEELRAQFVRIATAVLTEVQIGRGITDFVIKCDEEINTPDVVDRNEMRARIGVIPTRAVEFVFIEFSVHRTGSFAENADTF
jgi:phage tail sheath protein FI